MPVETDIKWLFLAIFAHMHPSFYFINNKHFEKIIVLCSFTQHLGTENESTLKNRHSMPAQHGL